MVGFCSITKILKTGINTAIGGIQRQNKNMELFESVFESIQKHADAKSTNFLEFHEFKRKLSEQFENFQNLTNIHENIALTPCYDLSAAYCAFTYLFDKERYEEIFESIDLDHVAVKEKYNNTSFIEFCL